MSILVIRNYVELFWCMYYIRKLVIRRGVTIEFVWRFLQIGFWLDALILREG